MRGPSTPILIRYQPVDGPLGRIRWAPSTPILGLPPVGQVHILPEMSNRTSKRSRRNWAGEEEEAPRCEHAGCEAAGAYRAPRSRSDLRNYFAFCLDHVRQYNLAWDYFANMTAEEIESQIRRDTVWERPTWRLGSAPGSAQRTRENISDPLGVFGDTKQRASHDGPGYRLSTEEERALALLEVEPPITKDRIKARYKALVKRHHPDANGGDKAAEERLKEIILAYTTLKHAAFP
jgi:DnaJ domain